MRRYDHKDETLEVTFLEFQEFLGRCALRRHACIIHRSTYNVQHTTYNVPHTTVQHTTVQLMQRATHNVHRTTTRWSRALAAAAARCAGTSHRGKHYLPISVSAPLHYRTLYTHSYWTTECAYAAQYPSQYTVCMPRLHATTRLTVRQLATNVGLFAGIAAHVVPCALCLVRCAVCIRRRAAGLPTTPRTWSSRSKLTPSAAGSCGRAELVSSIATPASQQSRGLRVQ